MLIPLAALVLAHSFRVRRTAPGVGVGPRDPHAQETRRPESQGYQGLDDVYVGPCHERPMVSNLLRSPDNEDNEHAKSGEGVKYCFSIR